MSAEAAGSIDEILEAAVELVGERREAFLRTACGSDAALLAEVRSLLAQVEASAGFLEGGTDAAIPRKLGSYAIGRVLGVGGMGTVHLGERVDGGTPTRAAIKFLHPDLRSADILRRFERERELLGRLDHPHIARLLGGGSTQGGQPYLMMEYVQGEPIDLHCDTCRLDLNARLALVRQVASAVDHAHRAGIVHRDIKPGNVLVGEDGMVKLLDFGIAKLLADEAPGDETRTGFRRLTPRYASPEQVRGEGVTPATDVYALGVLLYELVTGASPYDPADEIANAVLFAQPAPPSRRARSASLHAARARATSGATDLATRLRGDLDRVVMQALAKSPSDRYATASELADDLARLLERRPVGARKERFLARTRRVLESSAVGVRVRAGRLHRDSERQRQAAETIGGLLGDVLSTIDPRLALGRDMDVLRGVLDATARRLRRELPLDTPIAARLHTTIGSTYRAIGAFDLAELHLREALLARQRSDSEPRELAEAHLLLGGVVAELSRNEEARSLLRRGLALAEGEDVGPQIRARFDHEIGRVADTLGRDEEAERHLRAAAETATAAFGRDGLETLEILGSLVSFCTTRDRTAEAEEIAEENLLHARRGGDRFTIASALVNLAFLHRWTLRYAESEAGYREALALRLAIYGPDHPQVAATQNDLAAILEFRGAYEEAEVLYRRGLETDRRCSGPRSLAVGSKLNNLGGLLRKMGRLVEAQGLLEEALDNYVQNLGEGHDWVIIARTNVVITLLARGDYPRAEREALQVEQQLLALRGAESWRVALARNLLGEAISRQGRRGEGLALMATACAALTDALGEGDPRTRDAQERRQALVDVTPDDPER